MINRREFLGQAAGTLAAASVAASAPGRILAAAPSDQINLGIIGPGSRGKQLMRTFLRVPGVRFAGICDVYEPRFAEAQEITAEKTPTYKDYRQLLDAPGINAIVIATPLSFHAEQIIASLQSGRHVYGEKDMAFTVEECNRTLEAIKRSGKHYQLGVQYHYAPWFVEAVDRIRAGKLGRITQIYAYWHRNNDWRRPVPDPKDRNLERLINWRMYREFSGGLLAELGTHYIDFANTIFGAAPESVVGSGGIDFWKDGREVPDNVQVVYRYPSGQTFMFSSLTTNRYDGAHISVFGTAGTIDLTQSGGTYYYEPTAPHPAVSSELVVQQGIVTGASFRSEMPYKGPGEDFVKSPDKEGNPDWVACNSFIDCLRNNKRPIADENVAWDAGVAVALGNQAIDQGTRIRFAEHARRPS